MRGSALLLVGVGLVFGQNSFQIPAGYEEISQNPLETLMASEKCGEGSTKGVKMCVNYDKCDARTNTIVDRGITNGFGIIDIRFGANSCSHPLEVCCGIPSAVNPSIGPNMVPEKPVVEPQTEPTVNPKVGQCGIRNNNGIDFKITGNSHGESEYGEFPWMTAILKRNYDPAHDEALAVCGGSLIAPNVILTGAHCVYNYKTHDLKVRAGEWDTQTERERLPHQERNIAQIIVHEKFNSENLINDVALLVLAEPFVLAEHIGTICLPNAHEIIESPECYASGWGKTTFGKEEKYQVILKKIELPTIDHGTCEQLLKGTRLGKFFILHASFLCAGGVPGKDTCTGDGGSPLVCPSRTSPGRYVQAGIVAWGIGCAEPNIPGVYVNVAHFRQWIDDHMRRLNFDDTTYAK